MSRIVRRQTPYQRISSYLNPLDHLLSLATDYEAFDWDNWQNTWGTPLGLLLNVFCMISRGHADKYRREANPVFGEPSAGRSMANGISYLLWVAQSALAVFSVGNAVYCFTRKRRYRLFESNIEVEPKTPSARRVPVDSSPVANSPLRILGNIIEPFRNDAASRAHPDESRDVWEVGVWDPSPLSLHILAFLSPVHVAIYFLALPITSHPTGGLGGSTSSAAVYFTVLLTQILLSLQIIFLKSWFVQQAWDQKVISKEVMHEYDAKYVHPRLNVIKRDVAVQCTLSTQTDSGNEPEVSVYTPQFNRSGFKIYANPNYSDLTVQTPAPPPFARSSQNAGNTPGIFSRGATPMQPMAGRIRQPQFDRALANTSRRTAAADEDRERENRSRRRETTAHAGYDQPARRMGTEGMVDWSRQNSRGLSPSKMSTPLKKGSSIRGSTYAESLGTPLGTPVRRRQF
ncbi:hypothetical protein BZA05DRAFT_393769 [Tricharina praecox]|uniref:uncharacterized protein n=1 Tax=Tricharina praecox TaxID=43433 RepID=UPI00222101FC|nr:uncharacterized protein BZA05DRAFT_393769 [Tricharina praecox]KAI5854293.1 hypothetical protein BZA05DRAFT_393769 [Tricharina praecox]